MAGESKENLSPFTIGGKEDSGEVSLVTGASGKLGRELVEALLKRGHRVRALVWRKESILRLPKGTVPFFGDITDPDLLGEATSGVDNVFHLASIVSEFKESTEVMLRVNVEGTRTVMEACEENGVPYLFYPSTLDVYGHKRSEVLTEESKPLPKDRYGHSKMLAEQMIMNFKSSVPSTIFRISVIYGPGFETSFFKIFKVIKEQKAHIIGDGQNKLSLVHTIDVLRAIFLAKLNQVSRGNLYNLTDGRTYTQQELYNIAADMLRAPRPTRKTNELLVRLIAKNRGVDTDELRFLTSSRIIDITKIKQQLGYEPSRSIEVEGMRLVKEFISKEKTRERPISN